MTPSFSIFGALQLNGLTKKSDNVSSSLVNPLRPSALYLFFYLWWGGYYFFRIHVKGVIEYFCDTEGGGAGHFVQLLIEFCQPTPGHK
jgi:hypothetical protein